MTHSPNKLSEFNATQDKLRKSELNLGEVLSQYTELESIVRKSLKSKVADALPNFPSCSKSESKSSLNCKHLERCASKQSKRSTLSESKCSSVASAEQKQRSLVAKPNSEGDVEQPSKSQIHKRIKQYHENVNNINALCARSVPEKTRFLKQLQKMNVATWKAQKVKNSVVLKLENYLN